MSEPRDLEAQVAAELRGHYEPPLLSAWMIEDELSVRTTSVLKNALATGEIPNLAKETVRSMGERFWLSQPNCGRKCTRELAEVLGGWPQDPPSLDDIRRELSAIRARLAQLAYDLARLAA